MIPTPDNLQLQTQPLTLNQAISCVSRVKRERHGGKLVLTPALSQELWIEIIAKVYHTPFRASSFGSNQINAVLAHLLSEQTFTQLPEDIRLDLRKSPDAWQLCGRLLLTHRISGEPFPDLTYCIEQLGINPVCDAVKRQLAVPNDDPTFKMAPSQREQLNKIYVEVLKLSIKHGIANQKPLRYGQDQRTR